MKDLEDYVAFNYKVEIVKDEAEEGYVFSIPALKGYLTCTNDLVKGMEMIEDAKKQWLMAALGSFNINENLIPDEF